MSEVLARALAKAFARARAAVAERSTEKETTDVPETTIFLIRCDGQKGRDIVILAVLLVSVGFCCLSVGVQRDPVGREKYETMAADIC